MQIRREYGSITRLLAVRNYLNNDFAMYKRLTPSRIRVEHASPAYLGLGIIYKIIFFYINF